MVAVKLELQQLRGIFPNQYFSTTISTRLSKLEHKVQRIEQATMHPADQTDQAARQLRAKTAVLHSFRQAENETPLAV